MDAKEFLEYYYYATLTRLKKDMGHINVLSAMEEYATLKIDEYKKQQQYLIPETNEACENLAQYDANHVEKYTSNH